jgi:hypothetical protein
MAAVVALLRRHMRRWTLSPDLLAGLVLDDPWADPELPSLVAVDEAGEIVGFTGVQVSRMQLDGRPIRGVHSGHGVVSPDRRAGATGALLIGRALSGAQDLTWSDGASDPVAAVFRTFGGQIDHARTCDWMLVLRPVTWIRSIAGATLRRSAREQAALRSLVPVGALPLQAAGPRLVHHALPESTVGTSREELAAAGITSEDATAAMIVEQLPMLNKDLRLWVDYDEAHLQHLFGLVKAFGGLDSFKGPLVCRLVRRGDRTIGWYAYVVRKGGASRVLHIHAHKREPEAVLGELIAHAREQGSAALAGRAEPHLHRALRSRLAVLGYARQPIVIAKDPELAAVMGTSSSLVTRLDGDLFSI